MPSKVKRAEALYGQKPAGLSDQVWLTAARARWHAEQGLGPREVAEAIELSELEILNAGDRAFGRGNAYVPHCRCGARWTGLGACHCAACHCTLSTASAFDKHRRNDECLPPKDAGLVNRDGLWGWPGERPTS